jgi:phosphoribosylformylglycinamidine (FGAM) synthase-like amidotransferase family enzyme
VVVIIDGDQVAELQMTSKGGGFASNTLLSATISEEHESVVVDQVKAGLVEDGAGMGLCNGQTNSIGETLAQGAGCDFDTWGVVRLRVARSDGVDLLFSVSISINGETQQYIPGSSSSHQW